MRLTGGQIIVETLIREGVPYIVGIPGHGPLGLSDALIKQDRLKVLQEIERKRDADSLAVFEPIAKRIWRPTGVEWLPRILQRAFAEMLTGRRGPVVVDLPVYVQCDSAEVVLGNPHTYRSSGPVLPDRALVGI